MPFLFQPWHILLAALCGMVNERQQQIIQFQNAQIETLLKKLGKKRLLFDDEQRRLLAVKAHAIGRKTLLELTTIVTPDTILRWHRKLVAKKFDSSNKRQPGRPRIRQEIVDAIVRFATRESHLRLRSHSGCAGKHRLPHCRFHRRQRAAGSRHRTRTGSSTHAVMVHVSEDSLGFYLRHGLHHC